VTAPAVELFSGADCKGEKTVVDAKHKEKLCTGRCIDMCYRSFSPSVAMVKGIDAASNGLASMRVKAGFMASLYTNWCFGTQPSKYKAAYEHSRYLYSSTTADSECLTFPKGKRPMHIRIQCFGDHCAKLGLPQESNPLDSSKKGVVQASLTMQGITVSHFEGLDGTRYRAGLMDAVLAFSKTGPGSVAITSISDAAARRTTGGVVAAIMIAIPLGDSGTGIASSVQGSVVTGAFAAEFKEKAVARGVANPPTVTVAISVGVVTEPVEPARKHDQGKMIAIAVLGGIAAALCCVTIALVYCLWCRQPSLPERVTPVMEMHGYPEAMEGGVGVQAAYPPIYAVQGVPVQGVVVGAWSDETTMVQAHAAPMGDTDKLGHESHGGRDGSSSTQVRALPAHGIPAAGTEMAPAYSDRDRDEFESDDKASSFWNPLAR